MTTESTSNIVQPSPLEVSTLAGYQQAPSEAAALIAEYERAAHDIQQQAQGALKMLAKVMHLEGAWAWKDGAFVRPDGVE